MGPLADQEFVFPRHNCSNDSDEGVRQRSLSSCNTGVSERLRNTTRYYHSGVSRHCCSFGLAISSIRLLRMFLITWRWCINHCSIVVVLNPVAACNLVGLRCNVAVNQAHLLYPSRIYVHSYLVSYVTNKTKFETFSEGPTRWNLPSTLDYSVLSARAKPAQNLNWDQQLLRSSNTGWRICAPLHLPRTSWQADLVYWKARTTNKCVLIYAMATELLSVLTTPRIRWRSLEN
jgi:hypothetical protein